MAGRNFLMKRKEYLDGVARVERRRERMARDKAEKNLPQAPFVFPEKQLSPLGYRHFLRDSLALAFPMILKGFLDEAARGGAQHLRVVKELMDELCPTREEKGSVERLLQKLEREEASWGSKRGGGTAGANADSLRE